MNQVNLLVAISSAPRMMDMMVLAPAQLGSREIDTIGDPSMMALMKDLA